MALRPRPVERAMAAAALLTLGLASVAAAQALPPQPAGAVEISRGSAAMPNVTVQVTPPSAAVSAGATVQFRAEVSGSPNKDVVWSATGGSISPDGLYVAPNGEGKYSVRAVLRGGTLGGTASVTVESSNGTINIQPGENIQSRVDTAPEGAVFLLRSGVHRLQAIVPKSRQTFLGEAGSILSGAKLLTDFTREGSAWVASGQTQQGAGGGECVTARPRCTSPEDLFINDVPLVHVASLSAGGPGRWFFDYGADKIYFWDDPAGRRVETSVLPLAFGGYAESVTIRGLTIEKFASPGQNGAIRGGAAWVLDGNEVRFNHGIGIHMGQSRQLLRNKVHHNGQMGIGGSSADAVVDGNEIAYNNYAGYNAYWEAGGTKFTYSRNLVVRNNFVHHNDGPGLWTDIDNIDILYEGNRVEDNALSGIFHEISYRATIRNNVVKRNGLMPPIDYYVDGAGILISSSADVEVYGNELEDNFQGITALDAPRGGSEYGPRVTQNLHVHNNTIRATKARVGTGRTGLESGGKEASYSGQNNRFVANSYYIGSNDQLFFWRGQNLTPAQWQAAGQDTTGTFTR